MIKIAVCDDEKRMAEEISEKVKEYLPGSETEIFGSGESLLASDMESFRILLLDIDLPGISGLNVAEKMMAAAERPLIIFVTGHDELVYDSLWLHPFGFVRKTYLEKELKKALEDAAQELASREKHFFIHTAAGDMCLMLNEIYFFEADGNYMKVTAASGEYRFRETMQTLENTLARDGFVRVHKGFLVNQDMVKIINSEECILTNDARIPFGRNYQEAARKKLMRGMLR
ncbi:MAG: response regulator transcription factor [Lachnospiraceae bacterium]|nr:response regulator transcription factor [Lachnospiraceae bacterium]